MRESRVLRQTPSMNIDALTAKFRFKRNCKRYSVTIVNV